VVREALGDLDRKLVLPSDPRLRSQPLAFTPADGFVLSRVDGNVTARELIDLIPLPPEETERSLLGLVCTGVLAYASRRPPVRRAPPPARPPDPPPRKAGAPPPTPPPPPAARQPAPPPAAEAAPRPAAARPRGPEEVRRLILETYASLVQRDYFEILGITRDASAVEVRAAYAGLARALHPDACRDPALVEVDAQREAVFLRVCQAYESLRDPESRAAYERDHRRRTPHPTPPVAAPVPDVTSTARAGPAPPASAEAPAPPGAAAPPPAPAPPQPSLEGRLAETIAVGEELLRDGHVWEAMQQLEPALPQTRGPLRVRAQLALARACVRNPKWGKRAEAHLLEVLREDPAQVDAHLLLGDIYRHGGMRSRAVAAYRKVLELRPDNRQARRELARLEGEGPPAPGGGSLLGFLKKR
jgi:hypothetical protein